MASPLEALEIQSINEYLDNIYESPPDNDNLKGALALLKDMIETQDPHLTSDGDDEDEAAANEEGGEDQREGKKQVRIAAMKQHILTTRPNFFGHLLTPPGDEVDDEDFDADVVVAKAELIAEMLRDSPLSKLAVVPFIDRLLLFSFQEGADESRVYRAWNFMAMYPIAVLLRPDPKAQDANKVAVKAISSKIQSFPDILSPDLKASDMTEGLVKKQKALTCGVLSIISAPLKPDAIPLFVQAGGLDVLLTVIARGPLSPPGAEKSQNESLENACDALNRLMVDSKSKALADALTERQAASTLVKQMTHVCGLDDVFSASNVIRALVALAKPNDALLKQVFGEIEKLFASDPSELGPGAPVVLWAVIDAATDNGLGGKVSKICRSKKYVPFFLSAIKPGASDGVLEAIGEALAARIDEEPKRQLQKGVSSPQGVAKIVQLFEWVSTQGAPDISATARVLHELVLPSTGEETGGLYDPDEELQRVDKKFCIAFGEALKSRWDAALALAPKDSTNNGDDVIITEPSEQGLAHMKNVKVITVLAEEQYTLMALLAAGLLDYLQALLIENPSPLSRRAGLELLACLTHDSSLSEDFAYVPDLIDAFKLVVVYTLENDPRALNRSLAMQWLNHLMRYQHPKHDYGMSYKPGVKFVLEYVSEERLVQMLKGTEDEAKVAAEMIESMVTRSTGLDVREKFRANRELLDALWNGLFWDAEKAPENQDGDIYEDAFLYGNIEASCGSALSKLLDPITDADTIAKHLAPRLSGLKDKEWVDFYGAVENMPDLASLAILKPETGILARTAEMVADEVQVPFAMRLLRQFSQGSMLARVHIAQDETLYPALVRALQGRVESIQTIVLLDLESLVYGSNVSKARFVKEGGIKPLLDIILSEDEALSRMAASTLQNLVDGSPESARAAADAGAIPLLESKSDKTDIFNRAGSALASINDFKDVPPIDRIEFTPEAYAEVGKKISDPAVLELLTKNLGSSLDEKQLGIMGGLAPTLTEHLRSNTGSDPKPILQALKALLVIDGSGWDGFAVVQLVGKRCGLAEVLKSFVESEDEEVKELAVAIKEAVEGQESDAKEDVEEGGNEEEDEKEDENGEENEEDS